ncbi:hypothetical protein GETHOR_25550 [Geothrix oryzae]|uniref:Glycosyl transferase family 1 domain-containing protein n=1 Tax=Geothrix oryzae TaxID=2927975 RepID=A0ABN6UZK0_9BACT|nr:glycosyltransferase [Geothrix oryzae]BDU70454.1 hypothetical protein GETHOR_25550 [Geothrix oryzae]
MTESPAISNKQFIFFTNIPAPYRIAFYNELYERGLDFIVYYMRETENDRNWVLDRASLKHPFYIDRGFYWRLGRFHIHFNPRLLWMLLTSRRKEVVIGGSWNDINVLILATLKRLGLYRSQLHFWSEANYLTIGASNDNMIKKWMRKYVYNASTGAQISSGRMVEITFQKWGMPDKAFIDLPNTIDESSFQLTNEDVEQRYLRITPTILFSLRLDERIKGLINFLKAIGDDNIRKARFVVAGDGPDRASVQAYLSEHNIESHVQLLGHCETQQLVRLYREAQVLTLPSFTDASPLVLVEGLRMKLPLLVSNRCGNHFEVLEEGKNGFLFDPFDPSQIKTAFESMLSRQADWKQMGEASGEIYSRIFDCKSVITRFISELNTFTPVAK